MLPRWIVSKFLLAFILAGSLLVPSVQAAVSVSNSIPVPQPRGYVNDFAQVLSPDAEARLDGLARSLQQATGAEMVFVIMPNIAPYDEFTYALAIFEQWKIGKAGQDNGVLVLLTMKERKLRIMPGYGLEAILPDGKLGRYRDEYLVPYLRQNQVAAGLENIGWAMAQDIAKAAGVKLPAARAPVPQRVRQQPSAWFIFSLVVVLLLFILVFRRRLKQLGPGGYYGNYFPYGGGAFRRGGGGFGGGFSGFGGGFTGGGGVGGRW